MYLKLTCVPRIGWVPLFDMFSENSSAPHKLKESDKPNTLTLFFLQNSDNSSIFNAPSQIEYCVCTLKLVKCSEALGIYSFYITIAQS